MTTKPIVPNDVLEATIAELQQEVAKLKQQVKDGEIELEATVDEYTRVQEELKEAKEEAERSRIAAERSDQVKSAFLASMSHELRTPLNAIINFTKFVSKGDLGPINVTQAETLNEVVESGQHLLSLINDVLDMSKIEAGSLRLLVSDDVDMNGVLENVVSSGKGLLVNKSSVELKSEIDPNLPQIRADRQRVLQILLNIVANACNYTDSGEVIIRAHQHNGEVVVAVQDTGPGIAEEDQSSIFEPFKQTKSGLRKGSGTGLGMPIAKNLTEVHGGRLWLESTVGEGTTFYVAIPVKAEHLTPTFAATGEPT